MTVTKSPIGFMAKMNSSVLFVLTPEFGKFKATQARGAGQCKTGEHEFAIKPEYKTVAGTRIRFADNGKQDVPVVLLLCPLPQSIICYDPIWSTLGEKYRVVAQAQGEFLEKFVDDMGLTNIHIVGPDVGMPTALYYAIHQKHEVASLMVGDGPGILPSDNGSIINKAVDSAFWRLVFVVTGAQTFVNGAYRLACQNYVPNAAEVADYVASYDNGRIGPITAKWFKEYPENLATIDPHLESLDIPTLLFWGDKDIFLTTDNAERLHQRLPKSKLNIFKNCGHFSYQDKPDEFAQMIINWVDGGYTEV